MPHTARRENVVECHDAIAAGEITVGCECDGMLAARSMSLNNVTGRNRWCDDCLVRWI